MNHHRVTGGASPAFNWSFPLMSPRALMPRGQVSRPPGMSISVKIALAEQVCMHHLVGPAKVVDLCRANKKPPRCVRRDG